MALSNRERQARWRAKLKAQAAGNSRLEDVFRDHMRKLLLAEDHFVECATEEELAICRKAAARLLKESDERLIEALNALVFAWLEDECVALSTAPRKATPAAKQAQRG